MQKLIKKISYAIHLALYRITFLFRHLVQNLSLPKLSPNGKSVLLCNLTSSPPFPGFNQVVLWLLGVRYLLQGSKVYYLYCNSAMKLCPQGSSFRRPYKKPPCFRCRTSRRILFYPFIKIPINIDSSFEDNITKNDTSDVEFIHTLRHFFKRFHLDDNEDVRHVEKQFHYSASNIISGLKRINQQYRFDEIVVFNGVFYPEQTIRKFYKDLEVKVLSYEVGFISLSFFMTEGLAPEYDFNYVKKDLNETESAFLDSYLLTRFKGQFEMGFTKFWKEIGPLGPLEDKIKGYEKVVTLFTNSVYDTSTVFSNSAFPDLFLWLETTINEIKNNPRVFLIIRGHPDEYKDVSWEKDRIKKSQENIQTWLAENGFLDLPNLFFVEPTNYMSSYDLVRRSDFVIVYNSTVGLEALLMGKNVVLGGKPKYYRLSFLETPTSEEMYLINLQKNLNESSVCLSHDEINESRSFFYQLFFTSSAKADSYIEIFDRTINGSVTLKPGFDRSQIVKDEGIAKFYE